MKIKYKIVWLDDKPETMRSYINRIDSLLKKNFFISDIQEPYTSYEDFHSSFENFNNNDDYGEVFNDCDLLLIDYNIAEKQENKEKTGATLISELRSKGIYTETVFYSDAMDEYRKKPDVELDNVIYANKNELVNKVEYIIKKSVIQSMVISNLRGYLMDCTSNFDFICRNVSEYYFKQLSDEQQLEILQKAEEYIHNQYKNENEKFEKINEKYKKLINFENLEGKNTFKEIVDEEKRTKLLRNIFKSLESVIAVKDKFRLMALILQKKDIEEHLDIYSIENCSEEDKYSNDIITYRNKLAHNKLIYGSKCKNRIKIIEAIEDMKCDCSDNNCKKSYSYDKCKNIREKVYKYHLLFDKLFERILNS
jgi:hypothetical protein